MNTEQNQSVITGQLLSRFLMSCHVSEILNRKSTIAVQSLGLGIEWFVVPNKHLNVDICWPIVEWLENHIPTIGRWPQPTPEGRNHDGRWGLNWSKPSPPAAPVGGSEAVIVCGPPRPTSKPHFVWESWWCHVLLDSHWACAHCQQPWQSKREHQNYKGSRDQPLGGGMLGNYQQNSRILILSIYSLSNVYNN